MLPIQGFGCVDPWTSSPAFETSKLPTHFPKQLCWTLTQKVDAKSGLMTPTLPGLPTLILGGLQPDSGGDDTATASSLTVAGGDEDGLAGVCLIRR